jgi:predicted TIM-barrel fold metal-dependent hydrolase
MIIDAHHHYMPRKVFEKFVDPRKGAVRVLNERQDFIFNPWLVDTEKHLSDMDEAGIDMSVLTLAQRNDSGKEVCRMTNEETAKEVQRYPKRFIAAACLPQDNPEAAVEEADYAIKELKMPALSIMSSMYPDITLSSKTVMWPIYQKAQELNVPIFIHPNLRPVGSKTECTINRSISRGVDVAEGILRLMYDVLPEFPNVKFVIPHMGGAFLALKGRAQAFYESKTPLNGKPIPEELKLIAKTPYEQNEFGMTEPFDDLFNRFYIDGAGSQGWMPIVHLAMMTVNHDKLVWGTDYPYEIHNGRDMKAYIEAVKAMDIPEESKNGFLGDNLARLLKLI